MAEKILIVDDDLETLRLVGLMLQRQGYEIVAANNGKQALAQAKGERPDLIVLDILMPDMDGFEVTRLLRNDKDTSSIPILMFTAKSQVDDKVTGYESGADDYLTKPVHPAELIAHLKSLLSRRAVRPAVTTPSENGHMIGILGAKGGLGSSALTLNLGISICNQTKIELIAAELRPGNGIWASDLGFNKSEGLNTLLHLKPNEINIASVEKELIRTTYGPRLLLASHSIFDMATVCAAEQMDAIVTQLPKLASLVLLDIGAPILPNTDQILAHCDEIMLVVEPYPSCIDRTRPLITELDTLGFGKSKFLNLVIINRVRADIQLSITQIQETLGQKVTQIIPPSPEVAYYAATKNLPLVMLQPEGLVTQQFERLATTLIERIKR